MTTNTAATKAGNFKCPKCGWLARIDGGCAVCTPPAEPALAAEDAKPAAWVTPLHYGEQVTFYKPPAPAPGEDDEWYCYPLFRHPAPSACGVADSAAEGCLCQGCGNRYRGDLEVPDDVWAKISNGDNLLCASCIARRIIEAGIWTAIRGEDVDLTNMPEPEQSAGRWDGKHWLNGTAGNCNIVTYNGEDVVGVGYIANDNAREQVIADHNARLDAQSADTPSDDHEYACLRVVYEAARRYLRNEGVCKASELAQYRDNLCDAIEEVKLIDGGQYEPDADTPSEALSLTADEREWLEYAADHMADDSEPEDKACERVIRSLLARTASRQQPARGEASEAEVEAALLASDAVIPGTRAGGGIEMGRREREMRSTAMRAALEAAARVRGNSPKSFG